MYRVFTRDDVPLVELMYRVFTRDDVPLVEFMYRVFTREDLPLVEFMYRVFTRKPGESYRRRLRSLPSCSCRVFRALINSLVCLFLFSRHFVVDRLCRHPHSLHSTRGGRGVAHSVNPTRPMFKTTFNESPHCLYPMCPTHACAVRCSSAFEGLNTGAKKEEEKKVRSLWDSKIRPLHRCM